MNGTVKWFDDKKGFGFIVSQAVNGDVFAHYSEIETEGHRTLKNGQRVTFELSQDAKGIRAKHIIPLAQPQLQHVRD